MKWIIERSAVFSAELIATNEAEAREKAKNIPLRDMELDVEDHVDFFITEVD